MTVIQILVDYREALIKGLFVTLKLAGIVWFGGLFIGGLLGILSARFHRALGIPTRVLSFVLSGVPILALLYWAHYPLQVLLKMVIDPFYTAAAVLLIINIFAVSDLLATYLRDFPKEYRIAAAVCGLSRRETVMKIEVPLILRQLIPALLPTQVAVLHATLFASLISVEEIFRVAQQINASIYKPVEIYSALAVLFLVVSLPVNGLAIWLRARYTRDLSEINTRLC